MSRTPPELSNFQLNNKIFKAGAGAGKTTRLVREVYEFFHYFKKEHNKAPRIALTTFTRKATQELRERLMLFATLNKDDEFLTFVLSQNKLQISTIHGFLQIFLRQYAQLMELDPGFSFASDSEIQKNAKKILKSIVVKESDYLLLLEEINFKDLVRIAVRHSNNRLNYSRLRHPDFEFFENLKKTIFEKFKNRYQDVATRIATETSDLKWRDYASNLKEVASLLNKNQNYETILELTKSFRKPAHSAKKPQISDYTNEMCEDLKKDFSDLDPELFNEEIVKYDIALCEIFEKISDEFHDEFLNWKKTSGKISMSDLESFCLVLTEQFPLETEAFKHSYDYWLIDEYQDTSPIQVRLLDAMIGDKFKFVVGDPQQSIYFFRGARSEVFHAEVERTKERNGIFEDLNTNYRSSPKMMNFINHFFDFYSTKFQKMKIGNEQESEALAGTFSLALSEEEQAFAISEQVIKLLQKGVVPSQISVISRKNTLLKKISESFYQSKIPFILHSAQGFQERREVLDALSILKFLSVPYDNINLVTLLRSPWFRVKDSDIISVVRKEKMNYWAQLLKAANENPQPYQAILDLKKYLDTAKEVGISATFEKILSERGFFDVSAHYDSSGRRESNVWKLLLQLKSQDHKAGFNYIQFIERHERVVDLENLDQDSDAVSSLEPDRVNLMTVHMSKGLEFDHVLIPYIDKDPQLTKSSSYILNEKEGMWALSLKGKKEGSSTNLFSKLVVADIREQELAEADRLLYVAMTRAKKTLHFFASGRARNSSWLKNISLDLSEGVHSLNDFSYQVSIKDFKAVTNELKTLGITEVRKPYMDTTKKTPSEGTAVTQLVKSKQGSLNLVGLLETAQHGIRIHKLLEALKYKNEDVYLESLKESKAYALSTLEFIKNLKEVPLQYILENGYAEWGYLFQVDGQKIAGQIDLWGVKDNEAWIIDYKTGSSRYKDTAFEQLRVYASAVKHFAKVEKVHLVALYPHEKKFFQELFT